MKFQNGDLVRLKLEVAKNTIRQPARVRNYMNQEDYPGGIMLDYPLEGSKYWNEDDLEPAPNTGNIFD